MEHVLTMANLKLKPSLFMPCPTEHNVCQHAQVMCEYDHGYNKNHIDFTVSMKTNHHVNAIRSLLTFRRN